MQRLYCYIIIKVISKMTHEANAYSMSPRPLDRHKAQETLFLFSVRDSHGVPGHRQVKRTFPDLVSDPPWGGQQLPQGGGPGASPRTPTGQMATQTGREVGGRVGGYI